MAVKNVTYKEPKGYFSASMRKEAKKWESEQKAKEKASNAKKK